MQVLRVNGELQQAEAEVTKLEMKLGQVLSKNREEQKY